MTIDAATGRTCADRGRCRTFTSRRVLSHGDHFEVVDSDAAAVPTQMVSGTAIWQRHSGETESDPMREIVDTTTPQAPVPVDIDRPLPLDTARFDSLCERRELFDRDEVAGDFPCARSQAASPPRSRVCSIGFDSRETISGR